jgi:hypothetical protein
MADRERDVVEGQTLDLQIPAELIAVFKGRPRIVFKKLEWYGIHPLPPELLTGELKNLAKDYTVIAVPKQMMER